jgi:hypothetical protein
MKNLKLAIGIAFAVWLFALGNAALATDKPQFVPPPKTVVVVEKDRDYSAALIGAGITYWLMRRAHKRRKPLVLVPPSCPTDERERRIVEACGK